MITATAALEAGDWPLDRVYDDTGQFCFTVGGLCLHNSGHAAYGAVNLVDAIRVSDDDFFYNLGDLLNVDPTTHPNGGPLQQWAHDYGIAADRHRPAGCDAGALPTPTTSSSCTRRSSSARTHRALRGPSETSGLDRRLRIANNSYWTVGDNVNTAVGQGDVQVSPLQLAVVYAALANGGNVVTPRVGQDVQSANGTIIQRIDPAPRRHLKINPKYLRAILTGLRHAASATGGTSARM